MVDEPENTLKEACPEREVDAGEVDLSLLKYSLAKIPWERMQTNDDALNFAETLRAAMEKRNAQS